MLRRSSWLTGRTTPIRPAGSGIAVRGGLVLATGLARDDLGLGRRGVELGRGRTLGSRRVELVGIVVVLALSGHRVLELAHAGSERPPELGQLLRSEDHDGDDQDDHQLEGSDVWHLANVLRNGCTRITRSPNAPVLPAARRGVKPLPP